MRTAKERVVAIAGASSGIGAATALALAGGGRGVKLALGARRLERLEEVAGKCRALGAEVVVVACDVAKRAEVERLVGAAVEKFSRLDVMIANAGYGFLAKIQETTEQQFNDIVATNIKGTLYAMQAAAAVMLKQTPVGGAGGGKAARGHIIAVSSGAARRGLPLYGVYAMTKAAQLSLAEAMRVELAKDQIYVSTVHPLTTATEFFEVANKKSRLRSTGLGHAQPAETVAKKIAHLIRDPRPELWPVPLSHLLLALPALFPRLADYAMAKSIYRRTR